MILRREVTRIGEEAGAEAVAVAFYDYATDTGWSCSGGRWFHAASTIKVPVLVGVFAAVEEHDLSIESRVHVRNQFYSVVDGAPYRIDSGRDANSEVHSTIGKTMKLARLAHHMIVTSSNLATNLLIDLVSADSVQRTTTAR